MKIVVDTHTHTISSGHHTNETFLDMAKAASKIDGLEYLCFTDHAPKMIGGTNESFFRNLHLCRKEMYGLKLIYGVELNVLDKDGKVDLPDDILESLTFSIASLHSNVTRPMDKHSNTMALINAMNNPFINIIGHPDDASFDIDFMLLAEAAAKKNMMIELNSVCTNPEGYRGYDIRRTIEMLLQCKRCGVHISLGSDSHGSKHIADFDNSLSILREVGYPEELIVNYSIQSFFSMIYKHRHN